MADTLVHDPLQCKLGKAKALRPKGLPVLKNYVAAPFRTPSAVSYLDGITDWPMYDNNTLGDCTCAAAGHATIAWRKFAGSSLPPQPALDDVLRLYNLVNGGQDAGAVESTVLMTWHKTGLGNDKIKAYIPLPAHNLSTVRRALYLFGGLYIGILLPQAAQYLSKWSTHEAVPEGVSWMPGSWGGHATYVGGFDKDGFKLVTWSQVKEMDLDFWRYYVDEAWAIYSAEYAASAKHLTEAIELDRLEADLQDFKRN